MIKSDLENTVREWLPEGYFLVDLAIKAGDNISVYIDSFDGVNVADCQALSRHITKTFDRDEQDYSLQVSSAGLDKPFKVEEQYKKNIGRKVKVINLDNETTEGVLKSIDNGEIIIEKTAAFKKKQNKETEIIIIKLEDVKSTKLCF
ncbi:MAG: ribosome assembly cofactor RimP [Bacteroidales bacterium]